MPQPENDEAALLALHLARSQTRSLPARSRAYSDAWLAERQTGQIAHAVGIGVKSLGGDTRRVVEIREAMEDAVVRSVKDGVDLATEAQEVKRRMLRAREAHR